MTYHSTKQLPGYGPVWIIHSFIHSSMHKLNHSLCYLFTFKAIYSISLLLTKFFIYCTSFEEHKFRQLDFCSLFCLWQHMVRNSLHGEQVWNSSSKTHHESHPLQSRNHPVSAKHYFSCWSWDTWGAPEGKPEWWTPGELLCALFGQYLT